MPNGKAVGRPIMGSSEGAAEREASATAQTLILRVLSAEDPEAELREVAYQIGRQVAHGLLDRVLWADMLRTAAIKVQLVAEHGEDAVQAIIAAGFDQGQDAAADDLRIEAEAGKAQADVDQRRGRGRGGTAADRLIDAALAQGLILYHAPDGTAFADMTVADHVETWAVRSASFKRWLRRVFYEETGGAPNGETLETAVGALEARAQFDGATRPVGLRVAEQAGNIYIDLCDDRWRVIEVSVSGWSVLDKAPVKFRRTKAMLALPEPVPGGTVSVLEQHLHMSGAAYVLSVSWLLAALRGRGPYPILVLAGEQGTGKSTVTRMLRRLVDPSVAALRTLPKDDRDAFIAASNAHVQAFDNLSGIPVAMADTICRLSTGGGHATRKLHTDSEEEIIDALRPVILNGIDDVATRSDLVDRALAVTLDVIPEEERRTEEQVWAAFDADAGRIFGGLLDALVHGLAHLSKVVLPRKPRMADYAVWVAACEPMLWEPGQHLRIYQANRVETREVVLDADAVAGALREHMTGRDSRTTTLVDLLADLTLLVPDQVKRQAAWPATPRGLSSRLKRLAPALRGVGITIQPVDKDSRSRRARIRIDHTPQEGESS
jgi:hypothetical protein